MPTYRICCFVTVLVGFFVNPVLAQDSTFKNSLGIEFILIKPGSMIVGKFQPTVNRRGFESLLESLGLPSPPRSSTTVTLSPTRPSLPEADYARAEELAKRAARPGFRITLHKSFYIGKFEVTQAQWKAVMGSNPAIFQGKLIAGNADEHPVENITWSDAQAFINKLNTVDKAHTYRLPTEFEWEYAARAGAQDDLSWKDIMAQAIISRQTTSLVGQQKPNAWGLYDTLGNVWEWVQDYYNEKPFADPVPPKKGTQHVLKGAPFYGDVKNATYLTHAAGPGSKYDVGLRILMEVK